MLPVRGATFASQEVVSGDSISIHAPRAGSDQRIIFSRLQVALFQSMLPVRGATGHLCHNALPELISIHAPRAGSDPMAALHLLISMDFNPCSPCGERLAHADGVVRHVVFQSMLPVRGATLGSHFGYGAKEFQSMLPVRGATHLTAD